MLIRNKELADFYQALMAQMERLPFCHTISKQGALPAPLAAPRAVPFVSGGDESDWSRRVALGQSVSRLFTPDKNAAASPPASPQKQHPSNTDTFLFPTLQMVRAQFVPRISLHASATAALSTRRCLLICLFVLWRAAVIVRALFS